MKKIHDMNTNELHYYLELIEEMVKVCREHHRFATYADKQKLRNDVLRLMGELNMGCYIKGEEENCGVFVLKNARSSDYLHLRFVCIQRKQIEEEICGRSRE